MIGSAGLARFDHRQAIAAARHIGKDRHYFGRHDQEYILCLGAEPRDERGKLQHVAEALLGIDHDRLARQRLRVGITGRRRRQPRIRPAAPGFVVGPAFGEIAGRQPFLATGNPECRRTGIELNKPLEPGRRGAGRARDGGRLGQAVDDRRHCRGKTCRPAGCRRRGGKIPAVVVDGRGIAPDIGRLRVKYRGTPQPGQDDVEWFAQGVAQGGRVQAGIGNRRVERDGDPALPDGFSPGWPVFRQALQRKGQRRSGHDRLRPAGNSLAQCRGRGGRLSGHQLQLTEDLQVFRFTPQGDRPEGQVQRLADVALLRGRARGRDHLGGLEIDRGHGDGAASAARRRTSACSRSVISASGSVQFIG
jgi:hypothetical protein